jgi:hypothetical protein
MKIRVLLFLFLFVSIEGFCKNQFFISKNDFIKQFSDTVIPERLICTNETGERVIVSFYDNAILNVALQKGKQKKLVLKTVRHNNGLIKATEITPFWQSKKPCEISLSNVGTFSLRKMFITYIAPYFDVDRVKALCKAKNDSLTSTYLKKDRLAIHFYPGNTQTGDSLVILENACYHIAFKDQGQLKYGVVKKITSDSIYVSENFKAAENELDGVSQQIHAYRIRDISELDLLKSGGIAFRSVKLEDYDIRMVNLERKAPNNPCWFSFSSLNGEIKFYRLWLTNDGFKGVGKKQGKIYWYEG